MTVAPVSQVIKSFYKVKWRLASLKTGFEVRQEGKLCKTAGKLM